MGGRSKYCNEYNRVLPGIGTEKSIFFDAGVLREGLVLVCVDRKAEDCWEMRSAS